MGERDAFGRDQDEDSLAGLGWQAGGPVTQPGPAPSPSSPNARVPPAAPPVRPTVPAWTAPSVSGTGSGVWIAVAVALALVVIVPIVIAVGHTAHSISSSFSVPTFPAVPAPTVAAPPRPAASLLRPGPFARALVTLRRGHYGRLRSLRVAADRVDAQYQGGGKLRQVRVPAGGGADVVLTVTGAFPRTPALALGAIDPSAPARMAAGIRRRTHARLDYAAMIATGFAPTWTVVSRSGAQFTADRHGRITKRIN